MAAQGRWLSNIDEKENKTCNCEYFYVAAEAKWLLNTGDD